MDPGNCRPLDSTSWWSRFNGWGSRWGQSRKFWMDLSRKCRPIMRGEHDRRRRSIQGFGITWSALNFWTLKISYFCTLLEHFRVLFVGLHQCAISSEQILTEFVEDCLMWVFDDEVMGSFASVPFNSGSSVLSIEKGVLSPEKSIKLTEHIVMIVFKVAFNHYRKLSLGFFEIHQ